MLLRQKQSEPANRPSRRVRLRLEPLEERIMLSTFVVNSFDDTVDDNPGDGVAEDVFGNTTLRAAIMEANARASNDEIELPAGTYRLTIGGDGEDDAATGDLDVGYNRVNPWDPYAGTLAIEGSGADVTVIDAWNLGDRVFHALEDAQLTVRNLTITGGHADGAGGGILASSGSLVVVENCAICGNFANGNGGGIASEDGVATIIENSTICGNTAFGSGGGLYGDGGTNTVVIEQCTISGNTADGSGGGLYLQVSGDIEASTIAANRADADHDGVGDGGGIVVEGGFVTVFGTIVADNTDTGGEAPDISADGGGRVFSWGRNLVEDVTGAGSFSADRSDITGVDPKLGPLRDNGGRTLTHYLLTGSPAIDNGSTCSGVDQRGWSRAHGTACDIGAVEVEPSSLPFSTHTVATGFDMAISVHSADVDGDGDLDVLGAARDADDITWWENIGGDGSVWSEHTIEGAFDGAYCVYSADIDDDGDLDVLGAANRANDITWWENTAGDGSAWTEHTIDGAFDGAESVYSADIDGDGDLDVLGAARDADDITWWENLAGDGSAWTENTIDGAFDGADSVYSADIDGDGDLDVLGAAYWGHDIPWWENTAGDGSAWTEHTIDGAFPWAHSVYSADIDGDGDLDVLGSGSGTADFTWWENTAGDGSAWTEHLGGDGRFACVSRADTADVDGDGDLDVLGGAMGVLTGAITWWENTAGDGTAWTRVTVESGFDAPVDALWADLDGDGDLDVLGAALAAGEIAWWENETTHSSASFPNSVSDGTGEHAVGPSADEATCVHSADVDGDGDLDAVGATYEADTITWWENTAGDGSAWGENTVDDDFDGAQNVSSADLDRDGDLDIFGAAREGDAIAWWENTAGDGSAWTEHAVDDNFDGANSVTCADVDGDGDLDLLGAAVEGDDIAWWENTAGDGSAWTEHVVEGDFDGASSVYSVDVDGDGDLDLLGAAGGGDDVTWWENDGTPRDGGWTAHVVDGDFNGAASVYSVDLDGDGDPDVLAAGYAGDTIAWWENTQGDGTGWTEHVVTEDLDGAFSVRSADLDGDGDLDVVAAGLGAQTIGWWENTVGDGRSWSEHTVDGEFSGAGSAVAADLDGDGDLDVLGASRTADGITWWENRGGQFGTTTTNMATLTIRDGAADALLKIVVTHRGRAGDPDLALTSLDLLFEESAGGPLTTAEANDVIENLAIYLDSSVDGVFDRANDTLVTTVDTLALTAGVQTVAFTSGDPNVRIQHGTPRAYFVVTELTSDASSQSPNQFSVTHRTESSSAAQDWDHELDLTMGWAANTASWPATASAPPANQAPTDIVLSATGVAEGTDTSAGYIVGALSGTDPDTTAPNNTLTFSIEGGDDAGKFGIDGSNDLVLTDGVLDLDNPTDDDGDGVYEVGVRITDGGTPGLTYDETLTVTVTDIAVPFSDLPVAGSFVGAYCAIGADVDRDGDLDVIGAGRDGDVIGWWENTLGNGTNWFYRDVAPALDGAISVDAADLDGDGDLDILGAAFDAGEIAWWENRAGDGTDWGLHTVDAYFDGAVSVFSADVDGDGDLDVLGAGYRNSDITWWENTAGDGTSWTKHTVDADFDGALCVHSADVDGDGDLDVLGTAYRSHDVTWWENRSGDGRVWTEHTVDAGFEGPESVYAADLDGDGDLDVLGAASIDDEITWWENTAGDGTSWAERTVDADVYDAVRAFPVDLDGDGDLDVLGASNFGDSIIWWESDGTPRDGGWIEHLVDGSSTEAYSVCPGDVDGDGDLDVLAAARGDDEISWWENETIHSSAFFPNSVSPDIGEYPVTLFLGGATSACSGDVDGDGDEDVFAAATGGRIVWRESDGTPLDGGWIDHQVDEDFVGATSLYPGDLDGDGDLDVLGAANRVDDVAWWENIAGDGTSWVEHPVDGDFDGAQSVYAADVDGDGDLDVLAAADEADDVTWWENTAGNGRAWTEHSVDADLDGAISVYSADVDGDGDLDVLAAARDADEITWWENTAGDGTAWNEHAVAASFNGVTSVYCADVDGDGDLDVLGAAASDTDAVTWWENTAGDGTTWDERPVATGFDGTQSVYTADLDDDGDLDVLAVARDADRVAWWENTTGDGTTWDEHSVDANFNGAYSVWATDLDRDGDLDVLAAALVSNGVQWWENRGGQFALATTDTAPETIYEDEADDLLKIVVTHQGRTGDRDLELVTFDLLLESGAGGPLTTAQASALIENLWVYRDSDADEAFDITIDTPVTAVSTLSLTPEGVQTVTFHDDDVNVRIQHGTPRAYFVVPELTPNAGTQTPNEMRVSHRTESSSTGQERTDDIDGTLEWVANVASSTFMALTPNRPPTDIDLSASTVAENTDTSAGHVVGALSGTDPDTWPPFRTLTFSIVGGADGALFSVDGSSNLVFTDGTPNFERPADANTDGGYEVRIRATDGGTPGLWYEETFTVTITDVNETPTDLAVSPSTVPENTDTSAGHVVGALSGTDPDTTAPFNTLTYTIVGGADSFRFSVDGSNNLVLTHGTPNFENPKDANADGVYEVTVQVADGGTPSLTYDETLLVTITDVNDPPTARNMTQTVTYDEDAASVELADIAVTDEDAGDTITATLTLNNPTTGTLTAASGNGETYTAGTGAWTITGGMSAVNAALSDVAFIPAANNDIDTTVTTHVEDAAGTGPADGLITLDVTAINDAPTATNLTQTHTYIEDAPSVALDDIVVTDVDTGDTITATLTLNDPTTGALSAASGNGETYTASTGVWTVTGGVSTVNAALAAVAFIPAANNETDSTVSTHVQDVAGTGPAAGTITLDVTATNDAPTDIALSTNTVAEMTDTRAGFPVGVLTGTDIDSDPVFSALTFTIVGGADAGHFSVDGSNNLVLKDGVLDYEAPTDANADGMYEVTVRARDGGGLTYDEAFTVTVTNVNDFPDVRTFTDGDGDPITVLLWGPRDCTATLTRATPNWNDPGDLTSIAVSGSDGTSVLEIRVLESGDVLDYGTTVGEITGPQLKTIYAPQVDLVGNGISLTGPLAELTLRDIADGADIILGGLSSHRLSLVARDVGDVDVQFPGILSRVQVEEWTDGEIQANFILDIQATDGDFGADLTLAGTNCVNCSLNSAYIAGNLDAATWTIPGLVRLIRVEGDASADLDIGSHLYHMYVAGDISGNIDVQGDLGREFRVRRGGRRRWVTEGLWCGGNLTGVTNVSGNAWRIEVMGQLRGPVTVQRDAKLIYLARGASGAGDITVTGHLTHLRSLGDTHAGDLRAGSITEAFYEVANGLDGAIVLTRNDTNGDSIADTTGGVDILHITNGSTANGSINAAGDLGALRLVRRGGRRRWEPVGLWTGGDVNADITVGGQVVLLVIEGQTNGDLTAASIRAATLANGLTATSEIETSGNAESLRLAGDVAGAIDIGGHLALVEIGYSTPYRSRGRRRWQFHDATFTGTLQAGSMGDAYCHATTGLQGTVTVLGHADLLHVTKGPIQAAVTIGGDLGEWRRVKRRGRWRSVVVGLWASGDVNADITVGGHVLDVVVDGQMNGDFTAGAIRAATFADGLTATSEIETSGDVDSLRIAGDAAGVIDIGGHLEVAEIGYSTPYRSRGRRRWQFHDATFTGTLQAGSMGDGYCHATTGLQGTVTVTGDTDVLHVTNGPIDAAVAFGGDLGEWRSIKRGGRWTSVPVGLYSGGDVNADISVAGKAVLIDIRGDLVEASINRAPGPAAELEQVIVAGRIRSSAPQWVRASTGTFTISDATRSGTVRTGVPLVFGNVTAEIV